MSDAVRSKACCGNTASLRKRRKSYISTSSSDSAIARGLMPSGMSSSRSASIPGCLRAKILASSQIYSLFRRCLPICSLASQLIANHAIGFPWQAVPHGMGMVLAWFLCLFHWHGSFYCLEDCDCDCIVTPIASVFCQSNVRPLVGCRILLHCEETSDFIQRQNL